MLEFLLLLVCKWEDDMRSDAHALLPRRPPNDPCSAGEKFARDLLMCAFLHFPHLSWKHVPHSTGLTITLSAWRHVSAR